MDSASESRFLIGMEELDRVLGGGIVRGSAVLVGGDPGIGKSTLLLQAARRITERGKVLYVSGEESTFQIGMRARRLNAASPRVLLLAETDLEPIIDAMRKLEPAVAVIDSIQTVHSPALESAPGSVGQIRECADRLIAHAKHSGTALFLVGHVTKDGMIAGPRVLEHMVDTVLYFEGDRGHPYRILRAVKNRFGSTNEVGVFEMKGEGLVEVANPSELFLAERPGKTSGSVVVCSLEGTRPILVELQALVAPTRLAIPRRMAVGVDPNRVSLILAVIEKRIGLPLGAHDVFVNVVGGLTLDDPAADLAIAVAVVSSLRDRPLAPDWVVAGEIGLGGEVRPIQQVETRLREAQRMGFRRILLPARALPPDGDRVEPKANNIRGERIRVVGVGDLRDAIAAITGRAEGEQ